MSTSQDDPSGFQNLFSITKSGLRTTAKASKDRIKKRQADRTLEKLYWKLGKEVVELVRAGEITHPGVKRSVEGIESHLKDHPPE
jgi:hypothetical protein